MSGEERLPENRWRRVGIRLIEGEEVRGDDPIEYFLPTGVASTFWVSEGVMAIEVPRIKRFLEEERMEGEKDLVLLSVGEDRRGEHKH